MAVQITMSKGKEKWEMGKRWKRTITFLTVAASVFMMSTVGAQAAGQKNYHWPDDPAVKAGGAWFRMTMNYEESTDDWIRQIEMSKTSAKAGFVPVITEADLSSGFATDGKMIYYIASNTFKSYTVKTGEIKTIKQIKVPSDAYIEFTGYFNKKIWMLARKEKFGAPALFSYQPAKKKFKTEKKNFLCFNAAAVSRYMVISEGRTSLKTDGSYKLKVFDKNTGKSTVIAKKGVAWGYASGGGGTSDYASMGKWFMYGELNKKKNTWEIKEYKFSNKKTYIRKSLKKNEKLSGLMWVGKGVLYYLSTDEGMAYDESRLVKAK